MAHEIPGRPIDAAKPEPTAKGRGT